MNPTTTPTRRRTTNAAPPIDWRERAACQGTDLEAFFSDTVDSQRAALAVCRRCPMTATCLRDAMDYQGSSEYDLTGVVGGLTAVQRRALRVELLLGNRPDLGQARLLASFRWAAVVGPVRDWPADLVAKELRKYGVLATPVTVRVALWWTGAKATVLRPRQPGDRRSQWERVRDECEDLVARLRDRGFGNRDVAAYLGISEDGLSRAVYVWRARAAAAEGVKTA
ncbi:WhiB family transcriptional regulator [Streptomyces sp. DHE17-7]|uniref:WhiB family transcriptional regulator n=1 Tax=Streptomyces sp. DHE17-7 TaxID=2759949 RepID=UPI000EDBC515|nr:WhiB family transcriptional regulator [Streptomyces sp. DHE17-7]MBJ6623544.1 WhiB family transcriptional regulator [Streptomyces sp. DHE17-7]RIH58276.1 WhiB family transcriptional regulator [Streptomyces sp. SHP22-7]RIH58521.1 WhiB family transcriptional regulator [Streptomyces sp. SHP22-7]